jgi:hypothetical protein
MYRRIAVLARSLTALLIAALGAGAVARAQVAPVHGRIEGTAVDSASGAPRFGMLVSLDGTAHGAISDAAGTFVIRDVPAGTYTLHARQLSARTIEMTVVVKAGQATAVALRVVDAPTTLKAMQARAKSPERDRFELSPNVGTISLTKSASKNVPQFGEPDVLRVVQLLPGVNARNDFSSGFNVRGGESDQNLILLDGYPIYNPFHLGGLFSTFLEETVGSIDLLTGGFGAKYGGRLSSILDVTSAEPDKAGLHGASNISVIASSLSVGSASADGRSSWMLSGRRTYADKFIAAISDNSFPYHFSDAQFHGVKALGKGELKLELTAYSGADVLDADLATFGTDSAQSGGSAGAFLFGWTNQLVGATLRDTWRDGVRLPLLGVADSIGFEQHVSLTRFATELDIGGGALSLSNSIHDLRIAGDVHWHRGSHERRLGYEASGYAIRYDVLSSASPSPLFQLAQHPTTSAIYYQESWKPAKRWITEAGVRVEHLTGRDFTAIEPRISTKYFVTPDLALSAAVGDYSQALHSLNREDIPVRIFDFWVASDQYTPVSTARHYVLGLERWLGPLRFARLEGWVKKYHNLLEQNTADDPAVRGDEFLVSNGTSYGFDVLLRQLEVGPVGGWVAYTYGVSSRDRDGMSYWPGHDRRHNLNIVTTYKPDGHFTYSARLGVSSGTPYTDIVGQLIRRTYNPRTHLFDDDRSKEVDPVGGDHNASRYPLFRRLDLGVSRSGEWRGMQLSPYISIVNALDAPNVFIYTFDYTVNPPVRNTVSQFPFLPSFGLTIAF